MTPIDFRNIRPIRNSANNGFEELCCQLAACEPAPDGSRFVRNGTPDGGVEAYWILPDNSKHGWQAKFFDTLGKPQWQQLDESVTTALDSHPTLTHYTICLRFDLPDARAGRGKSMRQKWDERVRQWTQAATERGRTVTFDLWGSHELLTRLSHAQHAGRRWFWFGGTDLSKEWFACHLDEVIAAAGPRYSSELSIDLPISLRFASLGYTVDFRNRLVQVRREYRNEMNKAVDSLKTMSADTEVTAAIEAFALAGHALFGALSRFGEDLPPVSLHHEVVNQALQARDTAERVAQELNRLSSADSSATPTASDPHNRDRYQRQYYHLDTFTTALQTVEDFIDESSAKLACRPALLLAGEAGTGKTHLLCDVARLRHAADLPTIVLLGQQLGRGPIWAQILHRLGLNCTRDEFLGALETAAETVGGRALILLDAINEASEVAWRDELPGMLAVIAQHPRIGIAVSCRSTYERQLVRDDLVSSQLSRVEHEGFASRTFDAIATFCAYYDIETLNAPPLSPEFENPLFLKLFCQGLKNRGLRRPPTGHHGLERIFSFLLESVNDKLSQPEELDYPASRPIVRQALDALADAMLVTVRYQLPHEQARTQLSVVFPQPGIGYSNSLLRRLIDEGILAEDLHLAKGTDRPEHVVRFGYERLADYYLARRLLDRYVEEPGIAKAFSPDGPIDRMFSENRAYRLGGLLSALIVMVPERKGLELDELIPRLQTHAAYAEAFQEALPWREGRHVTPQAITYVEQRLAQNASNSARFTSSDPLMNRLLLLAAQPNHPMNARWLHARLLSLPMPERDLVWSTYLHRTWERRRWQSGQVIERLVDWAWPNDAYTRDPCAGFDEEVIELAAITLTWCFTTSNRFVRDRATKALVCVLRHRLHLVPRLLQEFQSVDDLYVKERLICAGYGAVMHSNDPQQVSPVALAVYRHIFEKGAPPAHILLRDYARGIIEYAVNIGCVIDVDMTRVRPPYSSEPVTAEPPSWQELKEQYDADGYYSLVGSLAPEWGDFARYVLDTESHSHGIHTWTDQSDPFAEYRRLDADRPEPPDSLAHRWHNLKYGFRRLRQADDHRPQEATDEDDEEQPSFGEGTEDGAEMHFGSISLPVEQALEASAFLASLTPQERRQLEEHEEYWDKRTVAHDAANEVHRSQCLERDFASRWILTRVIELGWTPERFDAFERGLGGGFVRDSQKPERIGKKYQWLAYHELAARVLDHRPLHHDSLDGSQQYHGPWQLGLRDIDPSFLVKSTPPARLVHETWWAPLPNPLMQTQEIPDREWLADRESIPCLAPILSLQRPADGSSWRALETSGAWNESGEVREVFGRTHGRRITFSMSAWLVPESERSAFLDGIRIGNWIGMDVVAPDFYEPFLGEYGWSGSFGQYVKDASASFACTKVLNNTQMKFFDNTNTAVARTAMRYLHEGGSFDCSLTEKCAGFTPSLWLAQGMHLSWGRRWFEFVDRAGAVVAYDPSFESPGPRALVIHLDAVQRFVAENDLALIWMAIGEKLLIGDDDSDPDIHPSISVFRQIFSMSGGTTPQSISRMFSYLGESPIEY